jgi:uncharacterized membrane protein
MAKNTVYTESVITLNNQDAMQHLDELKNKEKEIRNELLEMYKSGKVDLQSKQFKQLQNQLVKVVDSQKEVNASMKKFQATMNNLNGASINQLQSAARKLNAELRKLSPNTKEFVAAADQLKKVRKRMDELNSQASTAQKTLGGFFTKIGWAGLITGAIAGIKKFGEAMIKQTQLIGDKWSIETAGWKNAYGSFIAGISSGKGWKELINNMNEAYKSGKEVATILDEIFEMNNSLSIKEAEYGVEIEKNKQIMRDTSKSDEERIEAANNVIAKEKELADERKKIATQEMDANKKLLQSQTHLSDQELDSFVADYNNNRKLIQQATDYSDKVKQLTGYIKTMTAEQAKPGGNMYSSQIDAAKKELEDLQANTTDDVKKWSETIAKYNLSNDDMVKAYVDSRVKMLNADAQFYSETTRANTTLASLQQDMLKEHQQASATSYKEALANADDYFKQLQVKAKTAYANGEISQEEYNSTIEKLQESSLQRKIQISDQYKQSTIDYQNQLLDLTIKQQEKIRKTRDDLEKDAASVLAEAVKSMNDELEKSFAEIDKEIEADAEHIADLIDKSHEIVASLHPAEALEEQQQNELDALDELHEKGLISEEDYQARKAEIVQEYAQKIRETNVQTLADGIEKSQGYIKALDTMVASLQDAATARVEAQEQKELAAVGDNTEEKEKIEAKYEAKKLKIRKKYANAEMAIDIAKTIANGAQAIVKTFAELGWPAGIAGAAIMAATTAAQVATIIAQRNAIMSQSASTGTSDSGSSESVGQRVATGTGYASGGYTTSSTNDFQEVGVVHANEWVAPAAMVRANPVTFARLESIRKSGSYHSGVAGYADGGAVTADGKVADVSISSGDMNVIGQFNDLMRQILAQMPLKAYVVYSDINAATELDNKIKSIVGKK